MGHVGHQGAPPESRLVFPQWSQPPVTPRCSRSPVMSSVPHFVICKMGQMTAYTQRVQMSECTEVLRTMPGTWETVNEALLPAVVVIAVHAQCL